MLAQKWLPQQSLLVHPRVRVYFGHGGVNGLNEAVYFGVPVVGMPVWADGEDNVRRLVEKGCAVMVRKGDNADTLYNAVVRARDDPLYVQGAIGRFLPTAKRTSLWVFLFLFLSCHFLRTNTVNPHLNS